MRLPPQLWEKSFLWFRCLMETILKEYIQFKIRKVEQITCRFVLNTKEILQRFQLLIHWRFSNCSNWRHIPCQPLEINFQIINLHSISRKMITLQLIALKARILGVREITNKWMFRFGMRRCRFIRRETCSRQSQVITGVQNQNRHQNQFFSKKLAHQAHRLGNY